MRSGLPYGNQVNWIALALGIQSCSAPLFEMGKRSGSSAQS